MGPQQGAEARIGENARERASMVRVASRQPGVDAGPNTACGGKGACTPLEIPDSPPGMSVRFNSSRCAQGVLPSFSAAVGSRPGVYVGVAR
jgi:hypothetical protein